MKYFSFMCHFPKEVIAFDEVMKYKSRILDHHCGDISSLPQEEDFIEILSNNSLVSSGDDGGCWQRHECSPSMLLINGPCDGEVGDDGRFSLNT